jgi:hypothetical protein
MASKPLHLSRLIMSLTKRDRKKQQPKTYDFLLLLLCLLLLYENKHDKQEQKKIKILDIWCNYIIILPLNVIQEVSCLNKEMFIFKVVCIDPSVNNNKPNIFLAWNKCNYLSAFLGYKNTSSINYWYFIFCQAHTKTHYMSVCKWILAKKSNLEFCILENQKKKWCNKNIKDRKSNLFHVSRDSRWKSAAYHVSI